MSSKFEGCTSESNSPTVASIVPTRSWIRSISAVSNAPPFSVDKLLRTSPVCCSWAVCACSLIAEDVLLVPYGEGLEGPFADERNSLEILRMCAKSPLGCLVAVG